MAQSYRDKTAIILGGASGIGAAIAALLAEQGARIVIGDVNAQAAAGVAADGQASKVEAHRIDITRAAELDAWLRDVAQKHGRIDYLFNCAGLVPVGPLGELDDERCRAVVAVNLDGLIAACRTVGDIMTTQAGGTIVNIASLAGLVPLPMGAVYSATKAGVVAFSLALRAELRDKGVRVVCICPGIVDTPLMENTFKKLNVPDAAQVNMRPGKGQSPRSCAKVILRAAARGKPLTVTPWAARAVWSMYRAVPWLYRWLLEPMIVQRYHRRRARRTARAASRDGG